MPRKQNPGPDYWKKKYQYEKASGGYEADLKRQKTIREYDKAGIDRTGKDIDHKKPLRSGGSAKLSNTRLRSPAANRGDNGHTPGEKAGKKFKK